MANKVAVVITIFDAETAASDLADLLCWWEGYKMGLKAGGVEHFIIAENGIEAARKINVDIKDQLRKSTQPINHIP
jgi:hypothetical protein